MIHFVNQGQEIRASDYWDSDWNKQGIIGCSKNAGTFRLLIPDAMKNQVTEMKTCKEIIISKGKYCSHIGYEFLFINHLNYPYCIHIGEKQFFSHEPADTEHGKSVLVSLWTRGSEKVFERAARFRVVDRLPYMRPWEE